MPSAFGSVGGRARKGTVLGCPLPAFDMPRRDATELGPALNGPDLIRRDTTRPDTTSEGMGTTFCDRRNCHFCASSQVRTWAGYCRRVQSTDARMHGDGPRSEMPARKAERMPIALRAALLGSFTIVIDLGRQTGRGPIFWSRRVGMVRNSRELHASRPNGLARLTPSPCRCVPGSLSGALLRFGRR